MARKNISRRDFLKGSAASAVTLAAASLLGQVAAAEEESAGFDREYDVVIAGAGGTGQRGGASADLLERIYASVSERKGDHAGAGSLSGVFSAVRAEYPAGAAVRGDDDGLLRNGKPDLGNCRQPDLPVLPEILPAGQPGDGSPAGLLRVEDHFPVEESGNRGNDERR